MRISRPAVGLAVVLAWITAAARPALPSSIDVTDWLLITEARDTEGPFVQVVDQTVRFPFQEVHTATDEATTAQVGYDFTLSEHSASFDFLFDHSRSGTYASRAEGIGTLHFVPTEPLSYELTGSFSLFGTRRILLRVDLVDVSAGYEGGLLYLADHESNSTPDESFTLGMVGGDVISREEGALAGTLTPGNLYQLGYHYLVENYPSGSSEAATGEGMLSFTLIPEPGSIVVLGLGAVVFLRRRR